VDAGFARWRGASVEELRERSVAEILDEGLCEELAESIAAAERGIVTSYRCAVSEPEGEPSPADVLVTPRYDEEGRPSGYMLVIVRA